MEKSTILVSGLLTAEVDAVKSLLKGQPYTVESCAWSEVREEYRKGTHDLLIAVLDEASLQQELSRLVDLKQSSQEIPIFVVSSATSWKPAVAMLKMGVDDYMALPLEKELFLESVAHLIRFYQLSQKVFLTDSPGSAASPFEGMIGRSEPMQEVFRVISAVAKSNATVLIMGESGTGKELVAKAIHRKSDRHLNRFVDLNCGAIPRDLLENELFGHEKGAFTGAHARYQGSFEAAHRGTLFLDEISEMDPLLQVKLLRVLQERNFTRIGGTERINVDVRIIAATNRELAEEIKEGRFREDLFYRLNVVNVMLPSLRERRPDIPLLAQHFLSYYSAKNNRIFLDFENEALEALINHDWPGNVRELENTIERVVVLHNASQVKLKFLPKHIQKVNRAISFEKTPMVHAEEKKVVPLDDLERQAIEMALMQYRGNVSVAAKKLQIGQATLYRKVKKYGIQI